MMNCGINGTIPSTELDRLRAAIPVLIKGAPQYTTEFNKNVNIGGNKILKISFFSFLHIFSLLNLFIIPILYAENKITIYFRIS